MPVRDDRESLARLVDALRPRLGDVVFVGGWAHRLHRLHPLAGVVAYPPLMTQDADIVLPAGTRSVAPNIGDRLRAAGFEEELLGDERPPVTHYRLGAEHGGFYAEFLTPLVGSGWRRGGTKDATARVAGVTAQKLRHLEVLLMSPWSVVLAVSRGFPVASPAEVRIPNAASYLAQKILIHPTRRAPERAKDVLYIHDTLEAFAGSLVEVMRHWIEVVKPQLTPRARSSVERGVDSMFAEVTDVIRDAAREAVASGGRTLSPGTLLAVCKAGSNAIFG